MAQYALGPPKGYQQLLPTTATALSLTVPPGSRTALITVSVAAIRYRDDGTAPTSSTGFPLAPISATVPSDPFAYQGTLTAIQVIAQASGAIVDVLYYSG